MMNVERMRLIVDVIACGEMPQVVMDAAARWQGQSLVHVRSSANHVFRVVLPDGSTGYLRLTPAAERSQDSVRAEVEFVQHAANAGLLVALPIASTKGEFVEEIDNPDDHLSAPRRYHAVVFAELPGHQLDHGDLHQASL